MRLPGRLSVLIVQRDSLLLLRGQLRAVIVRLGNTIRMQAAMRTVWIAPSVLIRRFEKQLPVRRAMRELLRGALDPPRARRVGLVRMLPALESRRVKAALLDVTRAA